MEVYRIWSPSAAPRAIVQIVHGMAEHIDRSDRMAKALNEAGFLVCGRNHRGHGPEAELLGYFADKDGWEVILKDAHDVSEDVKKQHPGVPFFLLGHSMGSYLARA